MGKNHVSALCLFWTTALGRADIQQLQHQNLFTEDGTGYIRSIHLRICGIHAIQHVRVCIGYRISQNLKWFWGSSLNSNPGREARCSKEQYDAELFSCGYYKRQVLLENCVSVQEERVSREEQGHGEPDLKTCYGSSKQEMNMDLSCVTYFCVSVLGPRRSWYLRGRADAVLATSPRCSKAWRQAEFYALNLISSGPLRQSRACSMDTAQSKPSSHVNSPQVCSARLAQQGPLTLPDDRGSLIEPASSHSLCPNFPQDKWEEPVSKRKILGICVRDACQ